MDKHGLALEATGVDELTGVEDARGVEEADVLEGRTKGAPGCGD